MIKLNLHIQFKIHFFEHKQKHQIFNSPHLLYLLMSKFYFTLLFLFNKKYERHTSLLNLEHGKFIVRVNSVIATYIIVLRITFLISNKTAHYTINITWPQEQRSAFNRLLPRTLSSSSHKADLLHDCIQFLSVDESWRIRYSGSYLTKQLNIAMSALKSYKFFNQKKKISRFIEPEKLFTVFTRAHQLFLSQMNPSHSVPFQRIFRLLIRLLYFQKLWLNWKDVWCRPIYFNLT